MATVMERILVRERTGGIARSEVVLCGLGLSLIALAMCTWHVAHGGLYYDDWSVLALGRFPPPAGLLHGLWLAYGQRPGQVLYYAALEELFGLHAAPRLALAAGMVTLQASCLFALLRRVGLRAPDAAAIAVLSLTFPFSDSVWLWGILSLASLAIVLGLLGVLLALRAFQRTGARALVLHAASLALYVASVSSYEIFAVAGALAGLIYARVVGWRRARVRWALDILAIALALGLARLALPIDVATPSRVQSLAGMLAHAGLIAGQGLRVAGAAALPLGGAGPWVGAGMLAGVLLRSMVVRRGLPPGDAERAELDRWLALALAGAVAALAAWAVYVPASDHYSPSALGTVNRMNALAGMGLVTIVYACLSLLARLLVRYVRRPVSPAVVAAAMALALAAGYLVRSANDASAWDRAATEQRRVLGAVRALEPRLPRGAVLYVSGAPLTVGPGVPVLNTKLDLSSAIQLAYSSPLLMGVPVVSAVSLTCGPVGPLAEGVSGAYGKSYLIDLGARRATALVSRSRCVARAGSGSRRSAQ